MHSHAFIIIKRVYFPKELDPYSLFIHLDINIPLNSHAVALPYSCSCPFRCTRIACYLKIKILHYNE